MQKDNEKLQRNSLKKLFLEKGIDTNNPQQVLEFILFFSNVKGDISKIASGLLTDFTCLAELFNTPFEKLIERNDITEQTAFLLKSIPQAIRYYKIASITKGDLINTSEKAGELLINCFIGRSEEVVYILCLDEDLQLLCCELICKGTVGSSSINSRKILEISLFYNAKYVILSHNHPRGVALPSKSDIEASLILSKRLRVLDIDLHDHIIVAQNNYYSLKEHNQL